MIGLSVVCLANGWVATIDVRVPLTAPLLGMAVGLLAALYPAWQATRVSPLTALRRD